MRSKTLVGLIILVVIIAGIFYGWKQYNRRNVDLNDVKPAYTVKAEDLIGEFQVSDSIAEKKYLGKTIEVQGKIKNAEQETGGEVTLVMGSDAGMSSIRFAMDSTYRAEASGIKPGEQIAVKGIFTGYQKDETGLLGSDVILNRCVINKANK